MALNAIEIVISFESTSTIDVSDVVVSQGEVGARSFTITRPAGYEDVDGWACIMKLRNSASKSYNYTIPEDNILEISDDIFTSGKLLMQFEFINGEIIIQDNTIFSVDIVNSLSHSMAVIDDDTFADFVAHMQDLDIHFELPDMTGNALRVLSVNSTEDGLEWVVMSGGAGGSTWGYIGGTITDQLDLMNLFSQKANTLHNHSESQIVDLDKYSQAQVNLLLSDKADVSQLHNHANKALLDTITDAGSGSSFLADDGTYKPVAGGSATWGGILGTLSNQTDLQNALDGKSDTGHTHVESEITDLDKYTQTEVDNLLEDKANVTQIYYNNIGSSSPIYVKIADINITGAYQKAVFKMNLGISGDARDVGILDVGVYGSSTYNTFLNTSTHYIAYNHVGMFESDAIYKVETDNGLNNYTIELWVKVAGYARLFASIETEYREILALDLLPDIVVTSPTVPSGASVIDLLEFREHKYLSEFQTMTATVTTVPINIAYDSTKDALHVYVNGEKMAKDQQYTATNTLITLTGFTLVSGDEVLIEVKTNML